MNIFDDDVLREQFNSLAITIGVPALTITLIVVALMIGIWKAKEFLRNIF